MNFELDEKVIYNEKEAKIIDIDVTYLIEIAPDTFKWVLGADLKKVGDI